jgi:hypothetical protein
VLGHLFAYTTDHGSYAGPQLGPVFLGLPLAYYRVREQYSVGTVKWNSRVTHVWQTNYTSCQA